MCEVVHVNSSLLNYTNLGDGRNEVSFGLVSLSLLKNIPVFIELKKIGEFMTIKESLT